MRGLQSLFTNLFPASVNSETERKGKKGAHLEQRDKAIACRYYYYIHIKRCRYDDGLMNLEKEFHITAGVITQRLASSTDFVKQLVALDEAKALTALKEEYPYYTWEPLKQPKKLLPKFK